MVFAHFEADLKAAVSGDVSACIKVSVLLGHVESSLASNAPLDMARAQEEQTRGVHAINNFIAGLGDELSACNTHGCRELVCAVIQKLARSVSMRAGMPENVKHRQHLWGLASWLLEGSGAASKRKGLKLDCAGLTLATYCICRSLVPCFACLENVHMTVAEDHCWIALGASGTREEAAEVAVEQTALQGQPPPVNVWHTWLYNAGHAPVLTASQVPTAVVASMDTCMGERGDRGEECPALRSLQWSLLECIRGADRHPLYPVATCLLVDLRQDALLQALRDRVASGAPMQQEEVRGELGKLADMYSVLVQGVRQSGGAAAAQAEGTAQEEVCCPFTIGSIQSVDDVRSWAWYPFWFLASFCWSAASVLGSEYADVLGEEESLAEVDLLAAAALEAMCAGPVCRYRYIKSDVQLCKSVDELLEAAGEYFSERQASEGFADSPTAARTLKGYIAFVDALCTYYSPIGLPAKIITQVLKVTRLCTQRVREQAVSQIAWISPALVGSEELWKSLKAAALRNALSSAAPDTNRDIEGSTEPSADSSSRRKRRRPG